MPRRCGSGSSRCSAPTCQTFGCTPTTPSAAAAAQIHARAFTYGKDIFVGPGESPADLALMAHESTHVVQQGAVEVYRLFDFVGDAAKEAVADLAEEIPGYDLLSQVAGQDLITGRAVQTGRAEFVGALLSQRAVRRRGRTDPAVAGCARPDLRPDQQPAGRAQPVAGPDPRRHGGRLGGDGLHQPAEHQRRDRRALHRPVAVRRQRVRRGDRERRHRGGARPRRRSSPSRWSRSHRSSRTGTSASRSSTTTRSPERASTRRRWTSCATCCACSARSRSCSRWTSAAPWRRPPSGSTSSSPRSAACRARPSS